jgi:hypothetical protein
MEYHGCVSARDTCPMVSMAFVLLILVGFIVFTGWPGLVAFVIYFALVIWGLVTNKTWRVDVHDGLISWDARLPFFGKQSMPASEITSIDGNLDEKYEGITLRLKDGRRRFPFVQFPMDSDAFVAAVIAEKWK